MEEPAEGYKIVGLPVAGLKGVSKNLKLPKDPEKSENGRNNH